MKKLPLAFLLYLSIFCFSSCQSDDVPVQENKFLVNTALVGTLNKEEFKEKIAPILGEQGSQALFFVQYGIQQYRITYQTKDVNGNAITASGAVLIPAEAAGSLAMGSLHHGTLFNKEDAPSYFKFETETTLASFMASTGIIIGMPDYVGYGESKNLSHPYEHYRGLGEPGADFIRAMEEMVKAEGLDWNGVLMLGGYSEGGYAAMSTHKWIEDNLSNELKVKLSVCGAGAYNKTASFNRLVNQTGSSALSNNRSYVWVLQTYNEIYGLNKPMSYFFKEPYANNIINQGLNVEINVSLNEILTDQFKSDFNAGTYPELTKAIADNDIYDWKPKGVVKLYHGTSDDYVPFINSETALAAMQKNGAADVTLTRVEGGTHGSTISEYFFGVLQLFSTYKSPSFQ